MYCLCLFIIYYGLLEIPHIFIVFPYEMTMYWDTAHFQTHL
jgi:hypothetical protein